MSNDTITRDMIYDTTILGGGPVGLFGAFYAGMRGMKTKIIDSLPNLGGQCQSLYPEKYIYDMPGSPKILAADLIKNLTEQAMRFGPELALGQPALKLEQVPASDADPEIGAYFKLTTTTELHYTRTVVICAGAGAMTPRKLVAENVAEFENNGVQYLVGKKEAFRGKRLLIVGGGDSALDWAMNLEPLAESVHLVHRSDRYTAHDDSVDWLKRRSRVNVREYFEVKKVHGTTSVHAVTVCHSKTKEEEVIECDAVLVNIGFMSDIGPLRDFGLELFKNKIVVDDEMMTNIPGVFAAGDICTHGGKLTLIATGVGEAATAANYAKKFIDPAATVNPGHSSSMPLSPTSSDIGHALRDMTQK